MLRMTIRLQVAGDLEEAWLGMDLITVHDKVQHVLRAPGHERRRLLARPGE